MAKIEDGCYSCEAGKLLLSKVLAGKCQMRYTRAAVGCGKIPDGKMPKNMEIPADYVMDALISNVSAPVNGECQVTVQINSLDVAKGFLATGILLYAEDPDEGEVPYTYLVLENHPEWIRSADSAVGKLAVFDLITAVGDVENVTANIDPNAVVMRSDVEDIVSKVGIHSLTIGSVKTTAAGTSASAEIVKTGTSAVLNLTIPKGETGSQGPRGYTGSTGAQGPKGEKGDKGDTGPQGPKGDKGDTGPQGPKGEKGEPGSSGASIGVATPTSDGLMRAADKTKSDSFTVEDGMIKAKGFKTTTDSGNRHVEVGPQDYLSLYTAKTGGSAAGLTYRNEEGTSLGSYGAYTENGLLKFYYIGAYASPLVKITPDGDVQANTFNGKTLDNATTSSDGFMSAADKSKLDGIAIGANRMIVDDDLSETSTNPVQNKIITSQIQDLHQRVESYSHSLDSRKVDKIDGKGLSANDYTTTEKNKLAGISAGANKTIVDDSFSQTSTNPVQNKLITSNLSRIDSSLANKVDKVNGKGLSTNDYTTAEKNKLAGIEEGARAVVMDTSLNSTSARPLTNAEITRQFGITNNNVASAQSTADSAQTTANAAKTKTDSFTVNSGIISLKGIKTTTDSGNKHTEIGPQAGVNIYPAKTSGSAQGFSFKNSSGTTIGSFGCYTSNEVLQYYYIGTYSSPLVKILPTGEVIAKKFTTN